MRISIPYNDFVFFSYESRNTVFIEIEIIENQQNELREELPVLKQTIIDGIGWSIWDVSNYDLCSTTLVINSNTDW